jgi:glycosyltransferase involved in cell wall biosynthesis
MKILYIIGQLGRGGAEQQLYYLLKYLRPEACVISLRPDGYWAEPIRELGIEVIELQRQRSADLSRLFQIVRIIRSYQPDITHLFIDNTNGLYGRIAAIISGHFRVVVGVRTHPSYDPKWYLHLRRWFLNRFISLIVTNSRSACDYLVETAHFPLCKVRFITNGIEIDKIVERANTSANLLPSDWQQHPVIGAVGGLSAIKAPEVFVQVAAIVQQSYPNARFVWVGDGELRERIELVRKKLGLQNTLLLAGQRMDVPCWLAAMDIFVLTSNLEGTPNSVMEAMAVGLPCVVTDVGGNRELVREGETGFVVPPGNARLMSERICQLIEDESLRRRMGAAGRNAIQAYDVHKMVDAYEKVYLSLLTEGTAS